MRLAAPGAAPFLALALIAISHGPASAWAPRTRMAIADEAIRLMPAGLRVALETHRDAVMRGMLEPGLDERAPQHRPGWREGTLDARVDTAAGGLAEAITTPRARFDLIARRFGELAHYVSDAGFPPEMSRARDARRASHFSSFCESRRERFPLVFYGHEDPLLEDADFAAFTRRLATAAAAEDERLARAYAAAGDPPDPAAFDDRSVPFAIGSLSYSRTVTSVVRAWLVAWGRNGGDTGQTPYWNPTTATGGTENDR